MADIDPLSDEVNPIGGGPIGSTPIGPKPGDAGGGAGGGLSPAVIARYLHRRRPRTCKCQHRR